MTSHTWQAILALALIFNALLLVGYRLLRMKKGGPRADAIGGAVLGGLQVSLAVLVWQGVDWARWPALLLAVLFAFVVTPIWTLAVFIPLRPGAPDWAFLGLYWVSLLLTGLAALLV
jgi:hypothetical protein